MTPSTNLRELASRWLRADREAWRAFFIYGVLYATLGPLVPLAVQGIVSNFSYVDREVNLLTVVVALGAVLALIQVARYAQIILVEILERRMVARLVPQFRHVPAEKQIFFFEVALLQKSLSKWAIEGLELGLILLIAPFVLMTYHPVFVVFSFGLWAVFYYVVRTGQKGLETALIESAEKYHCWEQLQAGEDVDGSNWLRARQEHFRILQRQVRSLLAAQFIGPVLLILVSAILFYRAELSLGQFVAIELIGGGLFFALGKLAKFMETQYGLMTSMIKIELALGGEDV